MAIQKDKTGGWGQAGPLGTRVARWSRGMQVARSPGDYRRFPKVFASPLGRSPPPFIPHTARLSLSSLSPPPRSRSSPLLPSLSGRPHAPPSSDGCTYPTPVHPPLPHSLVGKLHFPGGVGGHTNAAAPAVNPVWCCVYGRRGRRQPSCHSLGHGQPFGRTKEVFADSFSK